jgi:AraC family transcriptional regulator
MDGCIEAAITLNVPNHNITNEIYNYKNLCIYRPQNVFNFEASFDAYEFIIPLGFFPKLIVEKKILDAEYRKIFPVNPNQIHCSTREMSVHGYLTLLFDKTFFINISHSMIPNKNLEFINASYIIDKEVFELINIFIINSKRNETQYEFMLDHLSTLIAANILNSLHNKFSDNIHNKSKYEKKNISKVIEFLNDNYAHDYSLETIAKISNFSPYHFIKLFKAQTGQTPYDYILNIRINKAIELLKANKHNITEICYLCGFNTPSHFSTVFKNRIGFSPTVFLKSYQ